MTKKLSPEVERAAAMLAPVAFTVWLSGPVALALYRYAMETETRPDVVLAESVEAYLGAK